MPACQISEDLCNYAESVVTDIFESPLDQIETDDAADTSDFITKATKCKSTFTNSDKTQQLMKALIAERDTNFILSINSSMMFLVYGSYPIQTFSPLGSHIITSRTGILGTAHRRSTQPLDGCI